jgi:hypothetical protein
MDMVTSSDRKIEILNSPEAISLSIPNIAHICHYSYLELYFVSMFIGTTARGELLENDPHWLLKFHFWFLSTTVSLSAIPCLAIAAQSYASNSTAPWSDEGEDIALPDIYTLAVVSVPQILSILVVTAWLKLAPFYSCLGRSFGTLSTI